MLAELEVAAERFEMVETLRKGEEKHTTKADDQFATPDKSGKKNHNRKDRNKRYRNCQERWSKWKRTNCDAMSINDETKPCDKKFAMRTKGGDMRPRKERPTRAKKDELRAANKCFHCKQPAHLTRDCPEKKTIRPSIGSISFTTIDALHTTANAISLFSTSAMQQECEPLPRQVTPDPDGQNDNQEPVESPNTDEFIADLVTDPIQLSVNPILALATLQFTKDMEREINALPPSPESKYLEPGLQEPSHRNNKRYLARARRHGNSIALFDTYL